MTKESNRTPSDEMRPDYDLRGGVRGKYFGAYRQGTNVAVLDADVAAVFRDSESVNRALRQFMKEHGGPPED